MKFIADLHIHSHFSRATSQDLTFAQLHHWAQLKGVQVVGTGDLTHPGWLQEMKANLEPAEEGLFRLKDEATASDETFRACQGPVRFILSGEISTIYKKNDRVRKIHHVVFAPTFEAVEKIQAALDKIGNILADGRPIFGLDSRHLLEILLTIDPQNYLIPAHIWTPWFSLLGSKSGFDTVEECFGDLTPHIFALETGLSSDPPMNWRVSALDRYTLVSNSDAHSPQKLAREANVFNTDLSYPAIFDALKTGDPAAFLGTLEFFPEEGKYHYDGHRQCNLRWPPSTTLQHKGRCSKCGKPVTVGVMHRVETLADRPVGQKPARWQPFKNLIPLPEVLAEVYGVGPTSKQVTQAYTALLTKLGPEVSILQDLPLADIEAAAGPLAAEAIRRMRAGQVTIAAGYDGEYGVIKLFDDQERRAFSAQLSFLVAPQSPKPKSAARPTGQPLQMPLLTPPSVGQSLSLTPTAPAAKTDLFSGLNPAQVEAVRCTDAPLVIVAGPGTGKTRTLTHRLAYLLADKGVLPENMLAITFTNKAAAEMSHRLTGLLGADAAGRVTIKTFHAFGAMIVRTDGTRLGLDPAAAICVEADRPALLKQACPALSDRDITLYLEQISVAKNRLLGPASFSKNSILTPDLKSPHPVAGATPLSHWERGGGEGYLEGSGDVTQFADVYVNYEAALRQNRLLDFDDLLVWPVNLFETYPDLLTHYQQRFRWIAVDEYQDINLAQYRLLRLLTGPESNLCVIGDPDQAIYGFRGANRAYFLQFQQDFAGAKVLRLSQNYRSTQLILEASGQVIAPSPAADRVKIWSEWADPTRIEVYAAVSDKAEAEYVVHEIEKMVGGTSYFSLDSGRVGGDEAVSRSFADFAVLYRLNAQSQPLVEALARSGIPYQTVGQTPLVEYKEIQTILAYLWLAYNPASRLHFEKILSSAFKPEDIDRLWRGDVEQILAAPLAFLNAAQKKRLKQAAVVMSELKQATGQPVARLIDLAQSALPPLDEPAAERVRRLALSAALFDHRLPDFLESTVLQKETDAYDDRADRVTLMTLHTAKGLEFPVVFIVGCEESLLPYQRNDEQVDIEEERRLFYVGMTRAQHRLILTRAKNRYLFGRQMNNPASRFWDDIAQALKEFKQSAPRKPAPEIPEQTQLKLF